MRTNIAVASKLIMAEGNELLSQIQRELWFTQPKPFANHIAWHVGHLAVTTNFGLKVLGQELVVSKDWDAMYGRGSVPSDDSAKQPGTSELLAKMNLAHTNLLDAYLHVDESVLAAENILERLRERFPTNGDFAAYLLTSHAGLHVGQIALLRKLLSGQHG
jgi:hypothetical protein